MFLYELQDLLKSGSERSDSLPFELRALEAILILVVSSLQSDEEILINLIQSLLLYLEESIDRNKLKELLQYSKRLSRFEQRVTNIRDAIEEVLDQDEDLADMYLTKKKEGNPQPVESHQDAELILETYLKQVEELANTVESVSSQLKTTEDVVNIILDSQRNSLMIFEIRLTLLTVGLACGTFVSSLLGMNLISGFENHASMFWMVSAAATALSVAFVGVGLMKIVKMMKKLN
ncbi:Mitochondrial inner membrane magnesium transporter mrs2 [Smittium mucronatum]|uniref:Magnesium transporter n=1 Tax=Smittium mucronatum TaxID=133383 RepID=A0A1R0GX74_9FUNG|nr:Mitochondrial inner membrane magnesium transporter mrs2 [Smittium mucronatum]OLY82898.1 Mitochondrial inner membrane magnesium transporter mrs2 [Smittium mucronatum]